MPKKLNHYSEIPCYTTRDGSLIRELMHPSQHANHNQSLAEATVPAGERTALHRHHISEELYHVQSGEGEMVLEQERFPIRQGDTIYIAPGSAHCLINSGENPLIILCACSPAYSHEDTELLPQQP